MLAEGATTWTTAAPLPVARDHLAAEVLEGRLYAIGGRTGWDEIYGHLSAVHAYDPDTDTWTERAPIPGPRSEAVGSTFTWQGRLYVAGGSTPFVQPSDEVWSYDPAADAWTLAGRLPAKLKGAILERVGTRLVLTQGSRSSTDPTPESWVGCCLAESP